MLAGDWGVERLMALARRNGLAALVRSHANFDWHRNLIHAVLRHSVVGRILGERAPEAIPVGADSALREFSAV